MCAGVPSRQPAIWIRSVLGMPSCARSAGWTGGRVDVAGIGRDPSSAAGSAVSTARRTTASLASVSTLGPYSAKRAFQRPMPIAPVIRSIASSGSRPGPSHHAERGVTIDATTGALPMTTLL